MYICTFYCEYASYALSPQRHPQRTQRQLVVNKAPTAPYVSVFDPAGLVINDWRALIQIWAVALSLVEYPVIDISYSFQRYNIEYTN